MEVEITIDDEIYNQALDFADPEMDESELFNEALKVYIQTKKNKTNK